MSRIEKVEEKKKAAPRADDNYRWRTIYLKIDPKRFGHVVRTLQKWGIRAIPDSRMYDFLEKSSR